jgi:hypothetical protein
VIYSFYKFRLKLVFLFRFVSLANETVLIVHCMFSFINCGCLALTVASSVKIHK